MSVKPIPEGYRSVTPYLVVKDCARAIDYYKKAFGAVEKMRMDGPEGKISHAELRIGDSMIMLSDEMPGSGMRAPQAANAPAVAIFLYVENVDKVFQQATSAGGKTEMPLADMPWGDRYGKLTDPFGHAWALATHKEDVSPQEMARRTKESMAKAAQAAHAKH
jgi:PhnB protein